MSTKFIVIIIESSIYPSVNQTSTKARFTTTKLKLYSTFEVEPWKVVRGRNTRSSVPNQTRSKFMGAKNNKTGNS